MPPTNQISADGPEAEQAHWAEALARGQLAWPAVALPEELFRAYVTGKALDQTAVKERAVDLYLAAACAAGVEGAAEAFERAYLPLVAGQVGRLRLSADQLAEVHQRLRIRMLAGPEPRIAQYGGGASLAAYLRVCAMRIAFDVMDASRAGPVPVDDTEELARDLIEQAPTSIDLIRQRYLGTFQAALEGSLRGLPPRDKTILRFHFLDGLGIDALAGIYRVHRATAARWLVDIRRRVLASVHEQLAVDLPTTASEFRSLLRAVRPDLQLSLSRLLVAETPSR